MTELIKQYERDIELIRGRIAELKMKEREQCGPEDGSLRDRIELLRDEMYELMYSAALMRRVTGPKPITPSTAALLLKEVGDAAC